MVLFFGAEFNRDLKISFMVSRWLLSQIWMKSRYFNTLRY